MILTASELMTGRVITIREDEPMVAAAEKINATHVSGLPVINEKGELTGLVTEYDLISKGAQVHIPTFLRILKNIPMNRHDGTELREELEKINSLKVRDIANKEPVTVTAQTELTEIAKIFADNPRLNPIPVVDGQNRVVGVISRYDLLSLYNLPLRKNSAKSPERARDIDKEIGTVLKNFEKDYVVVSRTRPRFWAVVWIIMVLIGFILGILYLGKFDININ